MRWKNKREALIDFYNSNNKSEKTRIITKFLIFPTKIDGLVRWLEFANIKQYLYLYTGDMYGPTYCSWENKKWMDK